MNLTRNGLIVLISVIFVAGAGTAYAVIVLPTITLAGDVIITGDLTCTDCIDGADTDPGLFYKKTSTGAAAFFATGGGGHVNFYHLSCDAGDIVMNGFALYPFTSFPVSSITRDLGGFPFSSDTWEHAVELVDIIPNGSPPPADLLAPAAGPPPHPFGLTILCWDKTLP